MKGAHCIRLRFNNQQVNCPARQEEADLVGIHLKSLSKHTMPNIASICVAEETRPWKQRYARGSTLIRLRGSGKLVWNQEKLLIKHVDRLWLPNVPKRKRTVRGVRSCWEKSRPKGH